MADLAANIGANFSNYVGNSALGGGVDVGILNIDTKPLEDLGKYTMLYNKAQYDQRQKDAEEQAKQLASITAYDLTTAIPKDRELITKGYDELVDYARQNPTVLDYKNNPSGWLEYNKKKADFENQLKSAKTRSILYKVREDEIAKNTNPEMKAILGRNLQDEVAATDIYTPLKATQQYDLTVPEIPTPQIKSFDVTVIGDNENIKRDYSVLDMKDVKSKASAVTLGMLGMDLDETSPSFLAKTPEEQKLLRAQAEQRKAGKGLLPVEQANQFNAAIQQYMNVDEPGQIDIEAIKAKNPMLYGIIQQYDNRNAYVKSIADQIRAGTFKDKLGNPVVFGPNGLNEADYQPISYMDGITPDEIVELQIMAKAKPDTYKTTVQETDNLGQAQTRQETARHNKAMEAQQGAELSQRQKEWQKTLEGSETQVNGAVARGNKIFDHIKSLANAEGVITPDKLRLLTAEDLKYLGTDVPEERNEAGQVTQKAGFKPLDLKQSDDKKIAIQITGDDIRVLTDAVKNPQTGRYGGFFDNTRSNTKRNLIVNILNEELKTAGAKELNAYVGPDITNGVTTTTTNKVATSSGGTAVVKTKEIKRGDISAKAAAAGYTPKEYEAQLKKNGIKIID